MSTAPCHALIPYLGHGDDGAIAWSRLAPSDRRRTAMQAARDHDRATLWSLTEAWLRTFSAAGASISAGTVRSYRCGVSSLLVAWASQDLLRPDPDAAAFYLRQLERRGLAPTTIQARLAAGRGLYAALHWCRAVTVDPFAHCHVPHDPTPAWDKRMPYGDDEVAALLQAARDPCDAVLVLLGAHAGLRAQECTDLHWSDVHLARRDLVVRHGKGSKQRVVALSATLRQALQALERPPDGYVLPYRTPGSAWRHMQALCRVAGVMPKGVHALRHSAGTRLYAETRDLEATARHLGHAKLETTRIYAKWSDRQLRETIGRW
jgi:integrase/recombinase XerC